MFSVILFPIGNNLHHDKFNQFAKEMDDFDLSKYDIGIQIDPFYQRSGGYEYKKALKKASNIYWNLFADVIKSKGKAQADAQYELASLWKAGYVFIPNNSNTINTRIELCEIDKNFNFERTAYNHFWISILKEAAIDGHIGAQFELSSLYRYGTAGIRDIRKADEWEKLARYNLYLLCHNWSVYSKIFYTLEFGCMNETQIERQVCYDKSK